MPLTVITSSPRDKKRSDSSMALQMKPAENCAFDLVSLGECMIRLSPPDHGRIEFAPVLEVWVGGGEYNVAYALAAAGPAHRLDRRAQHVADGPHRCESRPGGRHGCVPRRHAQVRRRRQSGSHRPQLHRSRPLEARLSHALRSRPLRDRRHEAGRRRLEETLYASRASAGFTPAASSPLSPKAPASSSPRP